jgi:hypothetical protein
MWKAEAALGSFLRQLLQAPSYGSCLAAAHVSFLQCYALNPPYQSALYKEQAKNCFSTEPLQDSEALPFLRELISDISVML